jgi:hypothetical protein
VPSFGVERSGGLRHRHYSVERDDQPATKCGHPWRSSAAGGEVRTRSGFDTQGCGGPLSLPKAEKPVGVVRFFGGFGVGLSGWTTQRILITLIINSSETLLPVIEPIIAAIEHAYRPDSQL